MLCLVCSAYTVNNILNMFYFSAGFCYIRDKACGKTTLKALWIE